MLSALGNMRCYAAERARIMEHMRENERRLQSGQMPLNDIGTVFGYTLEQLTYMIEAVKRYTSGNLKCKQPKDVYSTIRNAITNGDETKPQTKEELAEHLYMMARKKPSGNGAPKWDKVPEKMKDFWRKQANELIVKSWEESQ